MRTQRGFTLIELVIAVSIVATVALAGIGMALSSRSYAVNAAATRFDALLDGARDAARTVDTGATLVFAPDAYGDGVVIRLYRNRPAAGPLIASNTPDFDARVALTETEQLHAPGFALTLHGDGDIGGIAGYTVGSATTVESGCPASGAYHFVFAYAGNHAERYVPCRATLAATGSIAYAPMAPAPTQPAITPAPPCAFGCAPAAPTAAPAICAPPLISTGPFSCAPPPTPIPTATPSPAPASCLYGGTPPNCIQSRPTSTPASDCGPARSCRIAEVAYYAGGDYTCVNACSVNMDEEQVVILMQDGTEYAGPLVADVAHYAGNPAWMLPGTNCISYGNPNPGGNPSLGDANPTDTGYPPPYNTPVGPTGDFTQVPWFSSDARPGQSTDLLAAAVSAADNEAASSSQDAAENGGATFTWYQDQLCDS